MTGPIDTDEPEELDPGPDNVIHLPGFGRPPQRPDEPPQEEEDPVVDAWSVTPPIRSLSTEEVVVIPPPAPHLVEGAVEALLLAADGPLSESQIDGWLSNPGLALVRTSLDNIRDRLRRNNAGYRLMQVAKGWQFRTETRFAPWVAAMRGGRPLKLSRAALETLAVCAYRQPVTRGEIELLRGVDSGGVLRNLCERGLVTPIGRKDEPGRPLIYGTSPDFLSLFGLRDLSDLPTLRDLRELQRDDPREHPGSEDGDDGL
jgi:segregation and condensation protein B